MPSVADAANLQQSSMMPMFDRSAYPQDILISRQAQEPCRHATTHIGFLLGCPPPTHSMFSETWYTPVLFNLRGEKLGPRPKNVLGMQRDCECLVFCPSVTHPYMFQMGYQLLVSCRSVRNTTPPDHMQVAGIHQSSLSHVAG